jgi:PAS domain S-box-containing protein
VTEQRPYGEAPRVEDVEQRRRIAERQFKAVFDGIFDALAIVDDEQGFVEANPAACALFGLPRERLIGRRLYEFLPPDLDSLEVWSTLRGAGESHGTCRILRSDGSIRDVEYSARANVLPGRHLFALREATERLQQQRALLESEVSLARVEEIARLGSWASDTHRNGTLVCSAETFRIFGLTRETFDGRVSTFFSRIHPEDLDLVLEANRRALRKGEPYSIDHRTIRQDGSTLWVHAEATVLRDGAGVPVRMVGTVQDITERRTLEEQLRQSQKMEAIGRLAGGIAHDFNNLLTAILGYSDLLAARIGDDDEGGRKDVEEIRKAGERAVALTRQLLAFSRKQMLQPRVVDLNDAVRNIEQMLRRLIGEHVELTALLAERLGTVRADPGQIDQVLVNLAVNARDAMPDGGVLGIETANTTLEADFVARNPGSRAGDYVVLSVKDTGTGMTEEVKKHIFEPFFTTKPKGKGTGLGLAMAYGFVKQSDGYIAVESEPGRGTTFRIYLPRVHEAAQDVVRTVLSTPSPRRGETILLVEDEAGVRRLSRTVLEEQGYVVLEAASGDIALEVARSQTGPIHLVVTDVVMPGMSGRELWDRLRVLSPDSRVLFMSGYTDDVIARHGVLEPGIAFLQKPFTAFGLAGKVREVLDAPRHMER